MTAPKPRRAVYSALFGGYEHLLEQPVAKESALDFILFTDDPELTSDTWQVRVIPRPLPGDLVRSARTLKIRGHESLAAEYDETLWIDNTVLLLRDPDQLLDEWLDGADLAMPAHSFRGTVAAEFDAVSRSQLDDQARIDEQLAAYAATAQEVLEGEALWTALLARRYTPQVAATMQVWLDHVLRYSRRDQLSVRAALAATHQRVNVIELENRESEWHRWPEASGRAPRGDGMPTNTSLDTVEARLARLHADLDELTLHLVRAVNSREEVIRAMRESTSWRATRALRRGGTAMRSLVARTRARLGR